MKKDEFWGQFECREKEKKERTLWGLIPQIYVSISFPRYTRTKKTRGDKDKGPERVFFQCRPPLAHKKTSFKLEHTFYTFSRQHKHSQKKANELSAEKEGKTECFPMNRMLLIYRPQPVPLTSIEIGLLINVTQNGKNVEKERDIQIKEREEIKWMQSKHRWNVFRLS